jgi:anti-sigma regulatory factor (Ser/Thr protein kinase)
MTAVHDGSEYRWEEGEGGGPLGTLGFVPVAPPMPEVRGPVLRDDALNYTPAQRSVTLARRRAERLVAEWGHASRAADVALVVSELGTNALLHGSLYDRLIQVRLLLTPDVVRVEVSDPRGDRRLRPRFVGPDATFGRGLTVVDELAYRWGTVPRVVGKTVYAEVALRDGMM